MRRLAAGLLVPAALALACADDIEPPAATGTPPPPDSGPTSTDTGGTDATMPGSGSSTGTGTADDTAGGSMQEVCEACAALPAGEGFCAAPHIPGVTDPQMLDWSCAETCVAVGDTTRWCGDDGACCEGSCDAFGRCGASLTSSGSSGGTDSGGSESGSSSGGASSSSTG